MWPVNGNYSAWQRELLGFVLEYRNAVLKRIRPGVTAKQIMAEKLRKNRNTGKNACATGSQALCLRCGTDIRVCVSVARADFFSAPEAKEAMDTVIARWKFSKPAYQQAARRLVNTGGGVFSHPVGMTVHDDGDYLNEPLRPGHVFAVDPQLRVPEEQLYIRYENTVAVTSSGVENFTGFLPSELNEIEKLMQEEGVVQKRPPLRL
jgi:Xaa-Pro aminopeptidase